MFGSGRFDQLTGWTPDSLLEQFFIILVDLQLCSMVCLCQCAFKKKVKLNVFVFSNENESSFAYLGLCYNTGRTDRTSVQGGRRECTSWLNLCPCLNRSQRPHRRILHIQPLQVTGASKGSSCSWHERKWLDIGCQDRERSRNTNTDKIKTLNTLQDTLDQSVCQIHVFFFFF